MFSIVIPLYNKENFIENTLNTVINQTYENYEILVVDDGSIDNSIDVVKNIEDKRIKLLRQENRGVSSARNYGISQAKHDFIAFLDADDTWHPSYLETMKSKIDAMHTCVAYCAHFNVIDGDTVLKPKLKHKNDLVIESYFTESIHRTLIWTSTCIVRRDILNQLNGFDEDLSHAEDIHLWIRISLMGNIYFTPYVGGYYQREDSDSLSRTKNIRFERHLLSKLHQIESKYHLTSNRAWGKYKSNFIVNRASSFLSGYPDKVSALLKEVSVSDLTLKHLIKFFYIKAVLIIR